MKKLTGPMKIAIGCGCMAVFGIMFGWVIFPPVLRHQLKKEMALSKKTDVRQMWEKIPFPLDFKVFFFNYTNIDEIQKGGTPVVKEVGPYHFEEVKEKTEIEDHPEDDTITFRKRDIFYFRPDLSGPGLTGEEILVIPHILILGSAVATGRNNMAMVAMVGKALNVIFDKPTDVFMRVKPLDILFRGIVINCAQTEFAPKAVCNAIKKDAVPGFDFEANNQFRFSFFGQRNNSIDKHVMTVKRGIKNIMEVGSIVAIDGEPESKLWRDSCNKYDGTDGTIFPPFLTSDDPLEMYSGDLCRSFKPWYKKPTSFKGIKTNRYIVNIGDLANDPEQNCFCDAPDKCPPKGMMDMMKCFKAPVYISLPHFLDCDPAVKDGVKGLTPNIEEHGIEIDFEPLSGTLIVVRQRLQFSIELMKSDKYEPLSKLSGDFAPIFWIEEGFALNKTFIKMLKTQLFIPMKIVNVLCWIMIVGGVLGSLVSLMIHFRRDDVARLARRQAAKNNQPVTTVNTTSHISNNVDPKTVSIIGQAEEPAKINM